MLDTPFLTKGFTETESDDTTLRGTMQILQNESEYDRRLERQIQEEKIFDIQYTQEGEIKKSVRIHDEV